MAQTVVIVGHGPSLKKDFIGAKIDTFDVVIRLKNCRMLLLEPHFYGSKKDVLCSSTEVLPVIIKLKAKEYWGYPKKGEYNKQNVVWAERQLTRYGKDAGKSIYIPLDICNMWNNVFRELGGNHPNVSTGVGALIIALDKFQGKLKDDTIWLAGFDKVWNPGTEGYESTVPSPFNDGGKKDTGHDWKKEHELLGYLATGYQVRIADLAGRYDVQPQKPD